MNLNAEFFKTLNIMYVESDEELRNLFSNTLNKMFKRVFQFSNALDALEQFKKTENNDEKIDVILSESILPDLSGLELLFKIRQINKNTPFIFVTENTDTALLLNSLRYDVTDYFVKPINEIEILKKIEETCLSKQQEEEINKYQDEIEEYLELINKVAIVFMFNSDTTIVYANDFFKELIKYSDEELMGQDYRRFFHYEMASVIIEEQSETLQKGNKWQGKVKFLTSIDSMFYTNCTILPIFDKNNKISKYVSINFLTTREENEKREFKKRVLFDLQETKRIYSVAQRKIDELNNILSSCGDYDILKNSLDEEQEINQENYIKLEELENRVKKAKDKYELLTYGVNKKINQISIMASEMKNIEERASRKVIKVADEIKSKSLFISRIKEEINVKSIKINDLEDVLNHRKSQVESKKGK
jgi:PAS domain S-box-containing protein